MNCFDSSHVVLNTIIWDNALYFSSSNLMVATYSNIEGGYTGVGNISSDPLFIKSGNGNYRLQSGSPCIDAASSDSPALPTDIFGSIRYDAAGTVDTGFGANGTYYDIGAYEFTNASCTDIDSDGYAIEGGICGPVDCNDANPLSYLWALEVCDGEDNSCNGDVDTDCIYNTSLCPQRIHYYPGSD